MNGKKVGTAGRKDGGTVGGRRLYSSEPLADGRIPYTDGTEGRKDGGAGGRGEGVATAKLKERNEKRLVIVTGKRGCGKTTFIRRVLGSLNYVDLGDAGLDYRGTMKVIAAFKKCSAGVAVECHSMPPVRDLAMVMPLTVCFEHFEVSFKGGLQNVRKRECEMSVRAGCWERYSSWERGSRTEPCGDYSEPF